MHRLGTAGRTRTFISVDDNCNSNSESNASLANPSLNDTEIDSKQFFTSSYLFQVKDIETFDITASIALVRKSCWSAAPELQERKNR
jgi:hypothetical protein